MEAHQQQRYRVLERLAAGGMAEVFLAESAGIEGFKKLVAIKRVLPALSEKKRFIAMFLDEARLSAHLSHSNVVQVFDIGVGESAYFIVMEYVDGADLKQIVEINKRAGKTFSVEQACFVAARICEGLTYAHELTGTDGKPLQIIHRDMSPPNVLITKHGEVKIVDFGLAKAASQLEKSEAGIIKGKLGYLSPEAAQGKEIDTRTDIFAVGIILWEMLAGRRLFYAETDYGTVKLVQEAKIPSVRLDNPAVPAELETILAKALARDPDKRYATASDLGRDLTSFLYKYGRPVGPYDIAEVVRAAVAHRKRSQPDKGSIIDKLIEEALLEFTSLQEGADEKVNASKSTAGSGSARAGGDAPAKLGFEDIGSWADEIDGGSASPPEKTDAPVVRAAARIVEPVEAVEPRTPPSAAAMSTPEPVTKAIAPAPSEEADLTPERPAEAARTSPILTYVLIGVGVLVLLWLLFGRSA